MKSSVLDYDLPPELIAQHPAERRDASRLLVYERATGAVRHRTFADLPDEVGDALVVVNDTRVVPARIRLKQPRGEGLWRLRLHGEPAGEAPLPPYIVEPLADPERYQTVYARESGSAAAPTAGLHFTPELLEQLDVEL